MYLSSYNRHLLFFWSLSAQKEPKLPKMLNLKLDLNGNMIIALISWRIIISLIAIVETLISLEIAKESLGFKKMDWLNFGSM